MFVLFWSLFVFGLLAKGKAQNGMSNSYNGGDGQKELQLVVTSPVFVCDDEVSKTFMDTSAIEVVRFNETMTYVKGILKMLKPFVPETLIVILLDKITNGKKDMMFSVEVKLCDEIGREDSNFYPVLKHFIDFPENCPVPEGDYTIEDIIVDIGDVPVPLNRAHIGDYVAGFHYFNCKDENCKEKVQLACAQVDLAIEPLY